LLIIILKLIYFTSTVINEYLPILCWNKFKIKFFKKIFCFIFILFLFIRINLIWSKTSFLYYLSFFLLSSFSLTFKSSFSLSLLLLSCRFVSFFNYIILSFLFLPQCLLFFATCYIPFILKLRFPFRSNRSYPYCKNI